MKYFLFEGGDVLGPFSAEELWQRKGFGLQSLVCPEEKSADEAYWKPAQSYELLATPPAVVPQEETHRESTTPVQRAENLIQQVNSTVGELSRLDGLEPAALTTPVDQFVESSPTEQPANNPISVNTQTVGQANPLEEYFNTMRTGDLGNILGIPDPKVNSDMNLSRVMEKEFEKTDPMLSAHPATEKDPFDEFTPRTEQTEAPQATTPDEIDRQTQAQLTSETNTQQTAEATPTDLKSEELVSASAESKADSEATKSPSPAQSATLEQAVSALLPETAPADTPTEPNSFAQHIAEEPSVKLSLPTQTTFEQPKQGGWWIGLVGIVGLLLLALGAGIWLRYTGGKTAPSQPVAPTLPAATAAKPVIRENGAAPTKTPPPAETKKPAPVQQAENISQEQQAIEIVQNHVLDKARGTIQEFFTSHYATQLAQGYAFAWSAEPLHKQVYVVKYRLAKTRKEPIVYIFQVDTSKKKLTGALNNITLDLVGKIK